MYDQRKDDPQGWHGSLAVLCGLAAIGLTIAGGPARPLGAAAAIASAYFWWQSRR